MFDRESQTTMFFRNKFTGKKKKIENQSLPFQETHTTKDEALLTPRTEESFLPQAIKNSATKIVLNLRSLHLLKNSMQSIRI